MRVRLMDRDRDADVEAPLPANVEALVQDLELERLLAAMAGDDRFLYDIARHGVLASLRDADAITYRQDVLRDCLAHPDVVHELYDLSIGTIKAERTFSFPIFRDAPEALLDRSVRVLGMLMDKLRALVAITDEHGPQFRSEGFRALFRVVGEELDEPYFAELEEHLRQLQFKHGALISAELGRGNKGRRYVLRRQPKLSWLERLQRNRASYSFQIADRDEAGHQMLRQLRECGLNAAANAVAQSADHILSFFGLLRLELAFYLGCLNLQAALEDKGEATCFPALGGELDLSARGLYDASLSLSVPERVVGNDVDAAGKALIFVTGANQGGKSTFLRSVGLAQLMLQAGMFVAAESFNADVRSGIFTHFKREEDATMRSGKLDEELSRMSDIADAMEPDALLLCNESFASTNEREGSEIARQIVRALVEAEVKVVFVTHLYDLAHGFHEAERADALFLRAERERTFRLQGGDPLPTSFGADVYRNVFGRAPEPLSPTGGPAEGRRCAPRS